MKIKEAYMLQGNRITEPKYGAFEKGEYETELLNVYPVKRQKLLGFGGAFTDSSAYNYAQMTAEEKQKTLELLFGEITRL